MSGEAGGKRKIYRRRPVWRTALNAAGAIAALAAIVALLLFFGLQKYIVYTPDGVRLDIPLLEPYRTEQTLPPA